MPDSNGKLIENDMLDALKPAELAIANFEPPSAPPDPGPNPKTLPPEPNREKIKEEVAQQAAEERTKALFGFLEKFIVQVASDEIDRRSIQGSLDVLRSEIADLRAILSRNNLS